MYCDVCVDAVFQEAKQEAPLTPKDLRECASKALRSSLQLVSRCSEIPVDELEAWYRLEVSYGLFEDGNEPMEAEDKLLEDALIDELTEKAFPDHVDDR